MSIAVSCPHCAAKMNVRDDMAGRRGKCPKCNQTLEIPQQTAVQNHAAQKSSTPHTASPATLSPEQIVAAVKEALAAMNLKSPAKAGSAAMICKLSKTLHYLLPVLFLAALAAVYFLVPADTLASKVLTGIFGVLAAMSLLSFLAPPRPKPPIGFPLDEKSAPLLMETMSEVARRLEAPAPKFVSAWGAALEDEGNALRLGASALAILKLNEVLGVLTREVAVQRSAGRRAVRNEFNRLRRLQGDREPGEKIPFAGQLIGLLGMLGRPVTWPLLVLVRATCEGELRQAELEADAIACELVGSRGWLSTIQRRRLVEYAVELAAADVPFQFVERSLRENRIFTVEENLQSLPQEVQQSILETSVDDPAVGDYRPSWQERIAAVQKLAYPGTLQCSAPARVLIANFDHLCKETTWLDCTRRFKDDVKRKDLIA